MRDEVKPSIGHGLLRALTAASLAVIAAIGVTALGARGPDGPVEPIWDRTPCAHCTMLVGDRAFAAQLQTEDGQVLDFDDVGCLFLLERERGPALRVRAEWFRHLREDRWVKGDRAAFVDAAPTPMGFGLGAVDAGTPAAIAPDAARLRVVRLATGGR